MLKAHNIDTSQVTDQAIGSLAIEDGRVVEPYAYNPRPFVAVVSTGQQAAVSGGANGGLTEAEIRAMSPQQINDRWKEIDSFLKNQR